MLVPQGCRRHHISGTSWRFKQAEGSWSLPFSNTILLLGHVLSPSMGVFLQLTRATSIGTLVMSGQRQTKIKFFIYPTLETARKGLWGKESGQSATIH